MAFLLTEDGFRLKLEDASGDILLEEPTINGVPAPTGGSPVTYVGSFVIPAANTLGDQTVTGIVDAAGNPFTPLAVIIFGTQDGKFSGTLNQEEWDQLGLDDGVMHAGQACESRRFAGSNWRGVTHTSGYSILSMGAIFSAGTRTTGYIKAFTSGGFTYTLERNPDGGMTYRFLALGGTGVKAKVVRYGIGVPGCATSGSSYIVTGVGFKPTGAIGLFGAGAIDTNSGAGGIVGAFNDAQGESMCVGWCDQSLQQYAFLAAATDGGIPQPVGDQWTRAYRSLQPGVVSGALSAAVPSAGRGLRIDSWDTDGFHATDVHSPAGGTNGVLLLIGGCGTLAGTFLQPLADGSVSADIPGFLPAGALFCSVATPDRTLGPAEVLNDESYCFGAYDGHRNQAYWHGARLGAVDSLSTSVGGGANWGSSTAAMQLARNNGPNSSTIVEQGRMTGVPFATGSLGGAWTGVDGTARQIGYLAFVALPAPPPPPPLPACVVGNNFGVA